MIQNTASHYLALAVIDDAILAAVTSNPTIRDEFDYALVDRQQAGLDKPSVVGLKKLYTLSKAQFEMMIGHLSSRDWAEIKRRWLLMLE